MANGKYLSAERTDSGDLLRRKWLMATLRRMTLPEPVTLTRFDMALCVFSFCFITLLSVPAGQSNVFNKKLRFSLCEREAHKGEAV